MESVQYGWVSRVDVLDFAAGVDSQFDVENKEIFRDCITFIGSGTIVLHKFDTTNIDYYDNKYIIYYPRKRYVLHLRPQNK